MKIVRFFAVMLWAMLASACSFDAEKTASSCAIVIEKTIEVDKEAVKEYGNFDEVFAQLPTRFKKVFDKKCRKEADEYTRKFIQDSVYHVMDYNIRKDGISESREHILKTLRERKIPYILIEHVNNGPTACSYFDGDIIMSESDAKKIGIDFQKNFWDSEALEIYKIFIKEIVKDEAQFYSRGVIDLHRITIITYFDGVEEKSAYVHFPEGVGWDIKECGLDKTNPKGVELAENCNKFAFICEEESLYFPVCSNYFLKDYNKKLKYYDSAKKFLEESRSKKK